MNNWRDITLGELITFQRGHDLPESKREVGNVPVVGSAGINGYHNKAKAKAPGVTVGRSGASIGKPFYIDRDFWPHNAALYVKNFKGNNPKFVYYFLKSLDFSYLNSGSAQPSLNRNILHALKIIVPSKTIQDKIAAILSAYDDLIENNKRRIALLENMAEEIYREWFVRFRFPGYQQAKFEKGIPEGWEVIKIKEAANFQYGYTESAVYNNTLPRFLRVTDINKSSYISWHDVPNCPISDLDFEKYQLKKDDIVIARMADPGKVAIVEEDVNATFASYLIKIDYERNKVLPYYFFYTLRSDFYAGYFTNADSGSTRGSVNAKVIGGTSILLPPYNLMNNFESLVRKFRELITLLNRQNCNLSSARNMLLGRLISGKLSVENLDIQFPRSML